METTKTVLWIIFCSLPLISCKNNNNKSEFLTTELKGHRKETATLQRLDQRTFEIMTTDHHADMENFYVHLKKQTLTTNSLQVFTDMFRQEYCTKQCNINLYDDNSIAHLVTKYPLGDKEYLMVADHFVATSSFDLSEVWLYPFQDVKYKELGGMNWKKDLIK